MYSKKVMEHFKDPKNIGEFNVVKIKTTEDWSIVRQGFFGKASWKLDVHKNIFQV